MAPSQPRCRRVRAPRARAASGPLRGSASAGVSSNDACGPTSSALTVTASSIAPRCRPSVIPPGPRGREALSRPIRVLAPPVKRSPAGPSLSKRLRELGRLGEGFARRHTGSRDEPARHRGGGALRGPRRHAGESEQVLHLFRRGCFDTEHFGELVQPLSGFVGHVPRLDGPAGPGPVRIAQLPFEDLPRVLTWKGLLELDDPRHLEPGEAIPHKGPHVLGIDRRVVVSLDHGGKRLAELLVGDAEDRNVAHPGHRDQARLDLDRVDVRTTRDHHVPLAVAQVQETVFVEVTDVTHCDKFVLTDLFAGARAFSYSKS